VHSECPPAFPFKENTQEWAPITGADSYDRGLFSIKNGNLFDPEQVSPINLNAEAYQTWISNRWRKNFMLQPFRVMISRANIYAIYQSQYILL
jgi:hypothetical protein